MNNFIDAGLRASGWSAVGYGIGYVYNTLTSDFESTRAQRQMSGLVIAISAAVYSIFHSVLKSLSTNTNLNDKSIIQLRVLGDTVLGAVLIVADRHFNLIGELGTVVILVGMGINILNELT